MICPGEELTEAERRAQAAGGAARAEATVAAHKAAHKAAARAAEHEAALAASLNPPPARAEAAAAGASQFPSVGFLGAGVSSLSGELSGHSIFDANCAGCFGRNLTDESGLRLPDGVSANSLKHCTYSATSKVITTSQELQMSAAAYFHLGGHIFPLSLIHI